MTNFEANNKLLYKLECMFNLFTRYEIKIYTIDIDIDNILYVKSRHDIRIPM